MNLLLSNHIYEFVSALIPTGWQIFVPDNAKRQKPIGAANVHVVPTEVVSDAAAAADYILQNRIDVVYAQGRGSMVFFNGVRRALKDSWSFRIIVTAHTGYIWCVWWKSLLFLALARRYSDGLVYLAEALRKKYGWFAKLIGLRIWVVPNPVDLTRFPVEHDYSRIGKGPLHLGYVGIITPMKGQDVLIDAVRLLHKRGHKVKLTLVGDVQYEWYHDKLRTQIVEAGLADFVVIKPGIPYNEVPAFLATLDCYVCPTKVDVLPFSILEAMASGLPIVATKVGGIPDLIRPGENGFICPSTAASAIAASVQAIIENGMAQGMGRTSRVRAEDVFANEKFAMRMDAMIKDETHASK